MSLDMKLVTTEESDDHVIDVFWQNENNEFFNGYYRIYRAVEGLPYFALIDSVNSTRTYYTDRNVNTGLNSYRYRVEAMNICGSPVITNIHKTVRLSGNYDGDTTIRLNWNPYQGWPVNSYDIEKSQNEDTSLSVYGLQKDTSYIMVKTQQGYRQCFRIAAKESGLNN